MSLFTYYYVSAALELFAAFITVVMLLIRPLIQKQHSTVDAFLVALLCAHALSLLLDAPIWILLAEPSPERVPLIKVLTFLTDLLLISAQALYAWCLTAYISERQYISRRPVWYITGLSAAAVLTCLLSAFNEMYIGYDASGADFTGSLYWLYLLFTVQLPASTALLAFQHRRILGRRDTWVFASYGLIVVVSVPLQLFWAITPVYLAADVTVLLLACTVIYTAQVRRTAQAEKKLVEQELSLSESRNALMLSQIQPHFLYNALTAIYCLCDTRPETAKTAVSDFSRYLRGNLDSLKKEGLISFSDELRHTQAYLSLEKLRYEEALEVAYDIKVSDFLLPPLTIEPLVENAVNHGIGVLPSGGCVTISTQELPEYYEVRVADNGAGFDPALAQYVADYLGLELEIIPMDFDGVLAELANGTVDLGMAGLSPDPERADAMEFSDLYYIGGQSFVCLQANADKFPDLAATNDASLSIGAQTGSIQVNLAEENSPDADIVLLTKVTDIIAELIGGKLDGAYIETAVAESYAKNYPELCVALEVSYDVAGSSIGVVKGNSELLAGVNEAIAAALADGSMDSFVAEANELASGSVYEGLLDNYEG